MWRLLILLPRNNKSKTIVDTRNTIYNLLKYSIWNGDSSKQIHINVSQLIYDELKAHSIQALPANRIKSITVPKELKEQWKSDIIQIIAFYGKYTYVQRNLPIKVPYVILKGTSAAMYYPHPELRLMGDIDLMTSHEDFKQALQELQDAGYHITKELNREVVLVKNNIVIELHKSFSSLNTPEQAKYLDDLIINNINSTHVLPDLVNGVVLIEHAYKHLEGGLGLRQVIDWMMFVDKCLPDEKWPEFSSMIRIMGLETFTIVMTKMCEIFLGLPPRKWSEMADTGLCRQLMDYVMSSGNFGSKRTDDQSISENVLTYARTPKALFLLLQQQGLKNWKFAQKYKLFQPFAWLYQAGRYIVRGLQRDNSIKRLKSEYEVARKRNKMFDALGVVKMAEGRAIFKDGKYVK